MPSPSDIEHVASDLLATRNSRLVSCKTLQSLWAGYGTICRLQTASQDDNTADTSVILKYITPPHSSSSKPDEGHLRKILSYQVEQIFYTRLAPQMPPEISVASCLASINTKSASNGSSAEVKTAMVLTDLRESFPMAGEKRGALTNTQVHAALEWLANFHGFWWKRVDKFDRKKLIRAPLEHLREHGNAVIEEDEDPRLWLNGGYTYLATRLGEYASLKEEGEGSEWAEALCEPLAGQELTVAELVARVLAPASGSGAVRNGGLSRYETLIHGDVKSENLFTNEKGTKVAFYDFQYVGLGLGVCDLAKLFTCSVPISMLGFDRRGGDVIPMLEGEEKLLWSYLGEVQRVSGLSYEWDIFVRHWETALVDWLRFQASWGFWGNTEWLEGRVRSILEDGDWKTWLQASAK
ncbi:hypothetical protein VP1G_01889 [Cytospora mali]|uniref:Aminoglycoside phosphotransferase domain-containing protein n=1 Tax=Cytospora mali TaxID=578113 RepID=A0A194US43_CYTMA|nr:hypothetical protein VP1G_01889 [Valsa mali var. pyri (nom. inval.)]